MAEASTALQFGMWGLALGGMAMFLTAMIASLPLLLPENGAKGALIAIDFLTNSNGS